MLRATVDIFSGRPNPGWDIEGSAAEDILQEIALNRGMVVEEGAGWDGLGYRGVILEATHELVVERYGLPSILRIAGGSSNVEQRALELARDIVTTMPQQSEKTSGWSNDVDLKEFLLSEIQLPGPAREGLGMGHLRSSAAEEGTSEWVIPESTLACAWEATNFVASYWNDTSYHLNNNNCYNFATGRRTNTFAQPGRATGHQTSVMDCSHVSSAAVSDGAVRDPMCASPAGYPRYLTALAIRPGADYHWYRRCAQGYWAHKPGNTIARNYDNAGHVIYNPQTCNRGYYTVFCGYFYCPSTMHVS